MELNEQITHLDFIEIDLPVAGGVRGSPFLAGLRVLSPAPASQLFVTMPTTTPLATPEVRTAPPDELSTGTGGLESLSLRQRHLVPFPAFLRKRTVEDRATLVKQIDFVRKLLRSGDAAIESPDHWPC